MSTHAPAPAHILVVDDEPDLRTLYELTLLREGYHVDVAETVADAWKHLQEHRYEVLITDMRLPDGLGIELIQRLRTQQRGERGVVITAYGSAENAVESLKAGAFDYLTKPVDLKQFRTVIASAVQDALTPRVAPPPPPAVAAAPRTTTPPLAGEAALQRLVGSSPAIRQVRERILKVARSMAPVLICGESGTGKELTALALHANSHRAGGPMVAVNCSAIPENLLETEFFGVRKGAYTGASQDRAGYFQAAGGGTLFLDEIGDLPLSMQSKLLRAIQERCVRPVGGTQEETVDVRIVSATHKHLAREVQEGRFRQDLYYRLNVIEIDIPPLRERREDLPVLCEALLKRIAQESGLPVPRLTAEALAQLRKHPLNGNVRELENLLHRALALSDGSELSFDSLDTTPAILDPAAPDLAPTVPGELPPGPTPAPRAQAELPADLQGHLDRQEREILVKALQETGFNRTAAAAKLGLSLRQIRYRISRLNIDTPQDNDPAA
ncbi:sigma-54 dependent transcriptional regulator [Rhodoferax sp. BAB1]|uniref:sigma-54-dependent transcriptional regulator n=1 Tax=Rhodoferax sp. BAB1 TaxID=2741720 RepID=UPI001575E7C7|nr:sigma-54 dependent transcriptional regulator [Rhodoferax sp. BAB1]QKO22882.1 sigma-54-dependent Fis family transcriptional regulator [Rhodoferax sp. BAB1]